VEGSLQFSTRRWLNHCWIDCLSIWHSDLRELTLLSFHKIIAIFVALLMHVL